MLNDPKIIGVVDIPTTIRGHDYFSKEVAMRLPDIQMGRCLAIKFDNSEELRVGRKQVLMTCARFYGISRVETGSEESTLFVWLKPQELELAAKVKEHLFGNKSKVIHD